MYWWEERGQGCLLVTESGDLDSTARVYRRSFRSIVYVCWISEQNYGQQNPTVRMEAGKGREFGREKRKQEEGREERAKLRLPDNVLGVVI